MKKLNFSIRNKEEKNPCVLKLKKLYANVAKIYGKNESFVCEIVKEIKIDGSFLWYFRLQIL